MNRKMNKLFQSKTFMSVVLTMLVVAASAAVVWGSRQENEVEESPAYAEESQGEMQAAQDESYAREETEQNNEIAGFAAVGEGQETEKENVAAAGSETSGETVADAEMTDTGEANETAPAEESEAAAANAAPETEGPAEGTDTASESGETAAEGQAEDTEAEGAEAASNLVNPVAELPYTYFNEASTLQWPVEGSVLLDFSMDSTIYFPTLDLYKTNPAVLIQAEPGTPVAAPAEGKVVTVDHNEEIGDFVVIDMGNGYQAKCGQLTEIPVASGDIVEAGTVIGQVAEPTKYYVVEGGNLYFSMTKDGVPIDPLDYIQ